MGREGEKHRSYIASSTNPDQDQTHNLGDLSLCGTTPNKLNHNSQGEVSVFRR